MTFPVNTNIPFETHKPVNDVTPMRTNFANLVSTWAIDHYDPNIQPSGSTSGTHKQVTFPIKNVPVAPIGDIVIDFTDDGTAATSPQRFAINAQGTFPLMAVRAFGSFLFNDGVTTFINSYNCASLSIVAAQPAIVTLTTGATNGTSFVVVPFRNRALSANPNDVNLTYSIAANTVNFNAVDRNQSGIISFLILQV